MWKITYMNYENNKPESKTFDTYEEVFNYQFSLSCLGVSVLEITEA